MKFLHNIHILNKMKQEQRLPCFDNLQWVKCLTIWQIWICLNFNHWGSNLNSLGGKLTNSQITHVTKHCNQNFKLMVKKQNQIFFNWLTNFSFPKRSSGSFNTTPSINLSWRGEQDRKIQKKSTTWWEVYMNSPSTWPLIL